MLSETSLRRSPTRRRARRRTRRQTSVAAARAVGIAVLQSLLLVAAATAGEIWTSSSARLIGGRHRDRLRCRPSSERRTHLKVWALWGCPFVVVQTSAMFAQPVTYVCRLCKCDSYSAPAQVHCARTVYTFYTDCQIDHSIDRGSQHKLKFIKHVLNLHCILVALKLFHL